jgi:Holliday junction resolvasome RuvABC endonuclease subunit
MSRILGIDPGFASIGWAVVESNDELDTLDVVGAGVVRTKKAKAKQRVLAADDNFRRAGEIGRALGRIMLEHRVDAVCAEAMSFPRSSSVAAKMAMCWGVLAQLCETWGLPLVQTSPQKLKRAVTGNASASKDDVAAALYTRLPDALGALVGIPKSIHEHAMDAFGAIIACLESDTVRAVVQPGQSLTEGNLQKGAKGIKLGDTSTEGRLHNRQKECARA